MPDTQNDWYGPDAATFGDRVAAARERAGMNQTQLARRIGVKVSTLRGWEDDLSEPRANRLSMMAGLLNVSIMWLLTGEGDGMDGPGDDAVALDGNVAELLADMRTLRTEMRSSADKLGHLEKRLRRMIRSEEL